MACYLAWILLLSLSKPCSQASTLWFPYDHRPPPLIKSHSRLHGDQCVVEIVRRWSGSHLQPGDSAITVQLTIVQVVFLQKVFLFLAKLIYPQDKAELVVYAQVRA